MPHFFGGYDLTVKAPAPPKAQLPGWREKIIESLIRLSGISAVVIMALIFFFLLREGLPTLGEVSLADLFARRWYPIEDLYGILPLLAGSFLVTVGAVLIAVPLGLVTAVYLGEMAPTW